MNSGVAYLLLSCTVLIAANIDAANKVPNYRLPETIKPLNYVVEILKLQDIDHATNEFKGRVSVEVQVLSPTSDIVLNVAESVLMRSVNVFDAARNVRLEIKEMIHDKKRELYTITLHKLMKDQKVNIVIEYVGILHDDMYGFYRSSYRVKDKTKWIATTQFETHYARRAFPCFDEPQYKATFTIVLTFPNTYSTVLSNTEIQYNEDARYPTHNYRHFKMSEEGYKMVRFAKTPKMSTYLVAFVISDFSSLSIVDNENKMTTSIWTPAEARDTAQYSNIITPKLLRSLEDFTNINYTESGMNKVDLVAIPDFAAGAMENWGLLTYREVVLLYDPAKSTVASKQLIATVIAHELSHQWFGNLVTMKWWQYTWLNEGFARYFEYHIPAKVEPSWEMEKQFVGQQQHGVQQVDALSSAESLNAPANTPSEIMHKFGYISYNKGACVIRMLEHAVGSQAFKWSLTKYLKANKFGNTVPEDLWRHFSDILRQVKHPLGAKNLTEIMSTWTDQPGFPLITFSYNKDGHITIQQRRFLYNSTEESSLQWYVPITYTTYDKKDFENTKPKTWLKPNEVQKLDEQLADREKWIIGNIQSSGYYRVNYDDTLWDALHKALMSVGYNGIDPLNRAQLVDDAMNLARAAQETDYYPWRAAFSGFNFLLQRIGDGEVNDYLKTHIGNLIQRLYKSVTFDITPDMKQVDVLRTVNALSWACKINHGDCVAKATKLFEEFQSNRKSINPNLRSVVYCTALRNSNRSLDWTFLWNKFKTSTLAEEKGTLLSVLGCTPNKKLLKEYLRLSVDTYSIRKQDAPAVFSAVASGGRAGVDIALEFLITSHKEISQNYGSLNALSGVITTLADKLTDEAQVKKFEKFVEENKASLSEITPVAKGAIEKARINLQWSENYSNQILNYYSASKTSSAVSISAYSFIVTLVASLIHLLS